MSFEDFEVNMLISLISVQGQHIDPLNKIQILYQNEVFTCKWISEFLY